MAALAGAVVMAGLGQVSLRGAEDAPVSGSVARIDAAGVWVGSGVGAQAIGWDRVRAVAGDQKEAAAAFADVADSAWRARVRLERGDVVAAEPLFERLFETYKGMRGPTAAVVAEGLLRCRLRRAAHIAAIEPWLALLAARQEGTAGWLHPEWASEAGLGTVVDQATGLAPALPPIWLNWPSVGAFAHSGVLEVADPGSAMLAALYAASARFEAGMEAALPPGLESQGTPAGVHVVAEIVSARIGTPEQREEARQKLRARLSPPASNATPQPAWLEAWCRAGLGRSLLMEDSAELKRLGVVELLHVPARFARTHPYLAGIALAEAAATLRELGDDAGATVLTQELLTMYPTHPVRDWQSPGRQNTAAVPGAPAPARVLPAANEPEGLSPAGPR